MSYQSKIKMSIGWYYPIGIIIANIIVVAEIAIRTHLIRAGAEIIRAPFITYLLAALFFMALGVIQWFRYKNWIYPVLGILLGLLTFLGSFTFFGHSDILKAGYFTTLLLMVFFIIINWHSIYSHERFELNSRRLFRLASERIYEVDNGFTERPYSAGQIQLNKDEILGFVRFLHGNYIVRPFYYDSHVNLAFSMNRSLIVIREGSQVSNISLYFDGNINVKISEEDYQDYHERLSFDQLCSSMANVFVRFLDYYRKGLESRIITELKSAK